MAVPAIVTDLLDRKGVPYDVLSHAETFSSVEEAGALGIGADEVAKVLVVHSEGGRALFVLPASHRIDLHLVREAVEDRHARLATEDEMQRDLPAFALGSVPPIGELAKAAVFVDHHLTGHGTVAFAAGTHSDSIRMRVADLLALGPHAVVEVCRA